LVIFIRWQRHHLIQPTHPLRVTHQPDHSLSSAPQQNTNSTPTRTHRATSLLRVSHLVYSEATPIFYQSHTFDLSDSRLEAGLHDFLTSIGPNRCRHIRQICFRYHPCTAAATFRLLQAVESLERLGILGMNGWEFRGMMSTIWSPGLDELLVLRGLRTVVVTFDVVMMPGQLHPESFAELLVQVLRPIVAEAEGRAVEEIDSGESVNLEKMVDANRVALGRR